MAAFIVHQEPEGMADQMISCEIPIRVRYAECDPMGFVHHSKYFEYFEMARTELLRSTGIRYRDLEDKGILFVVAKVECRFRRPARYDDDLLMKVQISRMGRARIDHRYELYRDGLLLCEATSVLACVDRQGQVIPIPPEIAGQHQD
ncbi:MAG TPA: thioesterase family protein [Phycisphaerae bacterium]|nr:thioesterase family protein [Phycisphaerae bacterium]HRY66717.1 thioesterase family protein [Phycisphaerae bacterium]HSA29033.1 thioesterase family protein [Phycisphaerae bacterium]